MLLAEELSMKYPIWNTDTVSTRFSLNDGRDELQIEPLRIWIAAHGPHASANDCVAVMSEVSKAWQKTIGQLPEYQRVGFRAQVFYETEMSREELIAICKRFMFSDSLFQQFPDDDFALTFEKAEDTLLKRTFVGAMHHDELVAKWTPEFEIEREGLSYLTLDMDRGSAEASGMGFVDLAREAWGDMLETAKWLASPVS
jgi:hypothetical protein